MTVGASRSIALVKDAIVHLRQGNFAAAEPLLSEALLADPKHPEALGILGFIRYRQGRLEEAAGFLSRAVAADVRNLDAQMTLAHVLRDAGRKSEAIEAFRAAQKIRPDLADAQFLAGNLLHETGRLEEAEAAYRGLLAQAPGYAPAKLGLSAVLIEAGRPAEAEQVARSGLSQAAEKPLVASLEQNLGIALGQQYRFDDAVAAYARAQAANPHLTHLDHRRACMLAETGRIEEALGLFRNVLQREPRNLAAHRDYNDLLYRLGRNEEFLRSYDLAAGQAPDAPALPLAKADFLLSADRAQEAYDTFQKILWRDPGNIDAASGSATALVRLKQFAPALDILGGLIARQPGRSSFYADASGVLAQMREPKKALAMAEQGAAANPFDQSCLALIGTAYRMLGDAREERHNGYQNLVQVIDLEPPSGYADMASFNAELDAYLDKMHRDLREFVHQTLRGGSQTTNLMFGAGHVLVEKLRARIDQALNRYIASLPSDLSHPYVARRGKGFSYSGSWSSRLRDCGFHVNHIHDGWISAVYYIAIPDVAADTKAKQGWLKFGEPSYDVGIDMPARMVQPVPGRLVLFPSYTWHGTVPFRSAADRTTIAFDILPSF